jgi:hypothetical protein
MPIPQGIHPTQVGASAQGDHNLSVLPDAPQSGLILWSRAGAFDKSDLVILASLAHRLSELDNLNHVQ